MGSVCVLATCRDPRCFLPLLSGCEQLGKLYTTVFTLWQVGILVTECTNTGACLWWLLSPSTPHPSSPALRLRLGLGLGLQGTQQKEPLLPTCFLFLCLSPGNGLQGSVLFPVFFQHSETPCRCQGALSYSKTPRSELWVPTQAFGAW